VFACDLSLQLFVAFTVGHPRNRVPPSSDELSLHYSFKIAEKVRFELATPAGLAVQIGQEV
jgi:hypothetical protein